MNNHKIAVWGVRGTLTAVAAVAALVLAACGSSGTADAPGSENTGTTESSTSELSHADSGSTEAAAPAGGTVKIGLLPPTTGNTAAFGQEMMNGWNLYWDQNDNKAGDFDVESIHYDYGGDTANALSAVNKLVTSDKVSMVVGVLQGNTSLAVVGPLSDAKVPYIDPVAASDDMTQRSRSPYFIRLAGHTSSQLTMPEGKYAIDNGYKTAVTFCSDYAFGYESCGGFVNTFTDGGGKVLKQMWAPMGTTDYSSYISDINQLKPDVVFAQLSGADGSRFVNTWSSFGMKDGDIALLAGEAVLDDTSLHGLTAESAEGLISSGVWASGMDNEKTKALNEAYSAKYGTDASFYSASMYIAAGAIAQAIVELNGDVSDGEKLVQTLQGIDLGDTAMGAMTSDENGNSVQDVYIRQVAVVDGKLVNKVIETFPKVTQFWTYDQKEFLAHPAYSKTYQGDGVWPDPMS